jgi:hypothetical protein
MKVSDFHITVLARTQEINRLLQLSIQTNEKFPCLETDESLTNFLNLNLPNDHIEENDLIPGLMMI